MEESNSEIRKSIIGNENYRFIKILTRIITEADTLTC